MGGQARLLGEYSTPEPAKISSLRFVFDSDLNRKSLNMPCNYPLEPGFERCQHMVRAFRIEALDDQGEWRVVQRVTNNYQRLVRIDVDVTTSKIRFIPEETWGAETARVFSWDIR